LLKVWFNLKLCANVNITNGSKAAKYHIKLGFLAFLKVYFKHLPCCLADTGSSQKSKILKFAC